MAPPAGGLPWRPSTKAAAYATIVGLGVLAALLAGQPRAVVLVLPFAVVLVAGLARAGPLHLVAVAVAGQENVTEGDEMAVAVTLTAACDVAGLEVLLCPTPAFASGPGGDRPTGTALGRGRPLELEIPVVAAGWGRHQVGAVTLRARSSLGLLEAETTFPVGGTVHVYPRLEPLRRLVASRRPSLPAGAHLSPAKGTGVELAGVRPYARGDRAKDVNWRAAARHGGLFTNERHPERGSDVVLVLDTFDASVLDRAVVAACSLADAYLAQRDRLALVKLGGYLRWLRPGMGPRQRYLVVENLVSTTALPSAVYRGVDLVPPRLLPASALIIALSSLDEPRSRSALVDLSARGLEVVVIEVPPPVEPSPTLGEVGRAAYRVWVMQREMHRDGLRAAGAPTVEWPPGRPLAQVVEEVGTWARRRARSGS
ncbi:MAG: DUF58 domain-containing protein [Acidimicrobiales bacterium]